MVDILERLQSPQTSLGTLWPQPNLHEEAAEKITQLRKELDETKRAADAFVENEHLREEITRLREENARLREALKPFAELAAAVEAQYENCLPSEKHLAGVRYGDLRAAAAALKEAGDEGHC